MIQSREKAIGSFSYTVQQLGAGEGRKCLVRLAKTLGPVLGALMEDANVGQGKAVSVMNMDVGSISKALNRLAENLEEADLEYLCRIFGERTMVSSGDKAVKLDLAYQELHFVGRYGDMFRWLAFCLEVNFSDFFGSIQSMTAAARPAGGERAT